MPNVHACYCSGPQNGDPLCPCRMRENAGIGRVAFGPAFTACPSCSNPSECAPHGCQRDKPPAVGKSYYTTPIGWLCPKCHESNAPTVPTCFHCATKKGAAA